MNRLRRFRPSPALGVACVALLVALGGTGVAAVTALAPANSVGTAAIIDGSIQKKDIKGGVVPAPSMTQAFAVSVASAPFNNADYTPVATLVVPVPGSYVILAKTQLQRSKSYAARCRLVAGDDTDEIWPLLQDQEMVTAPLLLTHQFAKAGVVTLSCLGTNPTGTALQTRIVATRIDDLQLG